MPVVEVQMWTGRSTEQKRNLAELITKAFETAAGVPPEATHIIFKDIDKSDWSIGGKLCSEQ